MFHIGSATHPRVVDFFQDFVANGAEKEDTLSDTLAVGGHQFHANHFSVADEDILVSL